jgi:chromosome partitioning protein
MNAGVKKQLEEKFENKVFQTVIRTNIQLAKAQEAGKDIFSYDRSANGAKDYRRLAGELMQRCFEAAGEAAVEAVFEAAAV